MRLGGEVNDGVVPAHDLVDQFRVADVTADEPETRILRYRREVPQVAAVAECVDDGHPGVIQVRPWKLAGQQCPYVL